jgi:hypothetical protein
MTKRAGRVAQITADGKAGLVREPDGSDHPFTSDQEKRLGDAVMFELEERDFGKGVTAKFAKLD